MTVLLSARRGKTELPAVIAAGEIRSRDAGELLQASGHRIAVDSQASGGRGAAVSALEIGLRRFRQRPSFTPASDQIGRAHV